MIIGRGDIATSIYDRDEFTFFASGVSNSLETKDSEFDRERELLMNTHTNNTLVYFSTLSIYTKKSDYTRHKLAMEALIKKRFPNYIILRLGNITWGNNEHTFINYFKRKLKQNKRINTTNDLKYILTKREFRYHLSTLTPKQRRTINIMGTPMTPKQVLKLLKNGHTFK